MFKKWFGRNKDDDDEEDEDFDVEDMGDASDPMADPMSDPMFGAGGESSDAEPPNGDGLQPEQESPGGVDAEDAAATDDDDDYDEEDEDDEDEDEEGRFAALWENTWVRLSIIGGATIFLLVGIGVGGWWFISAGGDEELAKQATEENLLAASSGGGLQPTQSLNSSANTEEGQVPTAGQLITAPVISNEGVSGEQLAGTDTTSGLGTSGGLNSIGLGGGTGGLNASTGGGATVPGSGVVVPVSTASSYSQFVDYPTNDALPKAPTPELLEFRGGQLPLPKAANDGRVSWQEYARPSNVPVEKRRVALLITGMGLSRAATLSAISKLPAAVSLSFSPYAEELEQWMIRSRREGHEVVLGLPLESSRFPIEDPGPLALLTGLSDQDNKERLDTVLSSQQGYIGVEVSMGSKFTADEIKVRDLLIELNTRGLMVIDGAWNSRSLIPRIAEEFAMPRVITSVRLDNVMAKSAIDAKLKELDTVVELRGQGVGATTITPAIMERILLWISSLPGKGIELVPVSALINTQPPPAP